jgi:mitochondrial import inner membrane translocase subunit TIM21
MKPTIVHLRAPRLRHYPLLSRQPILYHSYATQSSLTGSPTSSTRRKTITPFNDTGQVPWGQLSPAEKISRTAQQSFNLTLVIVGIAGVCGVSFYLWSDVFSSSSQTALYNRAADKIRDDTKVRELLGRGMKFRNEREARHSNMFGGRRSPLKREWTDRVGVSGMEMRFWAFGEDKVGECRCLLRNAGEGNWQIWKLVVDIGKERCIVEDAEQRTENRKKGGKMFGVRWW